VSSARFFVAPILEKADARLSPGNAANQDLCPEPLQVAKIAATRTAGENEQREGRLLGVPYKLDHNTRGKSATAKIWSQLGLPHDLPGLSEAYPFYMRIGSA
jgi:hypothetical protein